MSASDNYANYIKSYLKLGALLFAIGALMLLYAFWWITGSGDLAMREAASRQAAGEFVIFGSGLSQNFMLYKLELYKNVRPVIAAVGSSRVMQFRGAWFRQPFVNMGGTAGNLAELRYVLEEMLTLHKPEALILGLDFWWFMPQWEQQPTERITPATNSYDISFAYLEKPWQLCFDSKISFRELLSPLTGLFGQGFRNDRLGIMAQQTDDGFGPDGSWYNTAELTGQKPPFDLMFQDTLYQVENGIRAFFRARPDQQGPAREHLAVFRDIIAMLKREQVRFWLFIPPLSGRVHARMSEKPEFWPHLFKLAQELEKLGLTVMDFTDPRLVGSSDCEFIDGFHGGEITYGRILQKMAMRWPRLAPYVRENYLRTLIASWHGHAMSADPRVTEKTEIDFNNFNCPKKLPAH